MRAIISVAVMMLVGSVACAAEVMPLRTVAVTGEAKRAVVPDEAHLTVNLNAQEPKLAAAKSAHDAKLKKLLRLVRDAGIDEKKVRTQSSGVQPVYRYDNDPKTGRAGRRLEGYRAQTGVDITVGDMSKLSGLMDAVIAGGFEQGATTEWGDLTSTYYTLSNPEKIREDMLVEAIANAKQKAEKMAAAVGASIARVYQMNETGTPSFEFSRALPMRAVGVGVMMDKTSDAGMAPPAGEQQVNVNVTVMFELKD